MVGRVVQVLDRQLQGLYLGWRYGLISALQGKDFRPLCSPLAKPGGRTTVAATKASATTEHILSHSIAPQRKVAIKGRSIDNTRTRPPVLPSCSGLAGLYGVRLLSRS